jgi:hypothetical protein
MSYTAETLYAGMVWVPGVFAPFFYAAFTLREMRRKKGGCFMDVKCCPAFGKSKTQKRLILRPIRRWYEMILQ